MYVLIAPFWIFCLQYFITNNNIFDKLNSMNNNKPQKYVYICVWWKNLLFQRKMFKYKLKHILLTILFVTFFSFASFYSWVSSWPGHTVVSLKSGHSYFMKEIHLSFDCFQ